MTPTAVAKFDVPEPGAAPWPRGFCWVTRPHLSTRRVLCSSKKANASHIPSRSQCLLCFNARSHWHDAQISTTFYGKLNLEIRSCRQLPYWKEQSSSQCTAPKLTTDPALPVESAGVKVTCPWTASSAAATPCNGPVCTATDTAEESGREIWLLLTSFSMRSGSEYANTFPAMLP